MEENSNAAAVVRCLHGVVDQGPDKEQGFIQVLPAQLGATPHLYGTEKLWHEQWTPVSCEGDGRRVGWMGEPKPVPAGRVE